MVENSAVSNILLLCAGNSARSILGEALASTCSGGRLRGHSAGAHPAGKVNPFAAELCAEMDYPSVNLRSKSWDEYAAPNAPAIQLIITVCDNAAGDACPLWAGHPATAHWGLPDPAALTGSDETRHAAFRAIRNAIAKRIDMLLALPFESMSDGELRSAMRQIGEAEVLDPTTARLFHSND
jgi:arsenate reductase (thioredoxin)